MMSSSFNTSLQQQHNVAHVSKQQYISNGVATAGGLLQSLPMSINCVQSQSQSPQHKTQLCQLNANQQQPVATMGGMHPIPQTAMFDQPQLQAVDDGVGKMFYGGANVEAVATTAAAISQPLLYDTANSSNSLSATHAGTILITNNFTQHQLAKQATQQKQVHTASTRNYSTNSITIVPASANSMTQQQHLYNITKNLGKDAQQHLQPKDALPFQQLRTSDVLEMQQLPVSTQQQFYVPTEASASPSTTEIMTTMSPNTSLSRVVNCVDMTSSPATAVPAATPTVLLDRINICINNHYAESTASAVGVPSTASGQLVSPDIIRQPSPIIPAIQHKAVLNPESIVVHEPYGNIDNSEMNEVIDEPDSTTIIPNTPPTTPENSSPTSIITQVMQSPSNTTTIRLMTKAEAAKEKCQTYFAVDVEMVEKTVAVKESPKSSKNGHIEKCIRAASPTNICEEELRARKAVARMSSPPHVPITLLTPPVPAQSSVYFKVGEDVLIQRQDGRFYLGTIIGMVRQQFLVRFDDKSELCCATDEMRKLGGSSDRKEEEGPMCIACKRLQSDDVVEICERCGRGYHRRCTMETSTGNGEWLCKRCVKPMKVLNINIKKQSACRQLPYHVDTLNWDEKHRVNEEQIYCYCGQSGKFDNMLQCCKCKNWFHLHCIECFQSKILRGDGFFVFCCSVCNDGREFLRRLQMNWVDIIHLTLYNLSAMKKHQHHKYHHLVKDIWPFILEKRDILPIPKEWMEMARSELLEQLKSTLKNNSERFASGREIKRDHCYYALRNNGPPILPKINVDTSDVLNDEFLIAKLKLTLLADAMQNKFYPNSATNNEKVLKTKHTTTDIYEFRSAYDEKFTSDDEIPIKRIMEKVKKNKTPHIIDRFHVKEKVEQMDDVSDDSGNRMGCVNEDQHKKKSKDSETGLLKAKTKADCDKVGFGSIATAKMEKSSRKRKAFTLSNAYKEFVSDVTVKRYASSRIWDSSSDENSSSSRGTTLDQIIPPLKNFLGSNNPFRIISPKKLTESSENVSGISHDGGSGNVIRNSIFNTSTLDFSSRLAALKSAGIFPNLSTSNLAKAAGRPRTVRTIKRRLSAKDLTIGPNKEIRWRRTRRVSADIEVISTTTINPISTNIFLQAKDALSHTANYQLPSQQQNSVNQVTSSSSSCSPPTSTTSSYDSLPKVHTPNATFTQAQSSKQPLAQGRRLRERPRKSSPSQNRRNSISSTSTTSSQSNSSTTPTSLQTSSCRDTTINDLKQSVNKYFGAINRIESGEMFSIHAKRLLLNGQIQYLIEWGDDRATKNHTD